MELPKIASLEEWLAARLALLAKEKQLSRAQAALAAERRAFRWWRSPKTTSSPGRRARAGSLPVRGPGPADHLSPHVAARHRRGLPELPAPW